MMYILDGEEKRTGAEWGVRSWRMRTTPPRHMNSSTLINTLLFVAYNHIKTGSKKLMAKQARTLHYFTRGIVGPTIKFVVVFSFVYAIFTFLFTYVKNKIDRTSNK